MLTQQEAKRIRQHMLALLRDVLKLTDELLAANTQPPSPVKDGGGNNLFPVDLHGDNERGAGYG